MLAVKGGLMLLQYWLSDEKRTDHWEGISIGTGCSQGSAIR